MQSTANNIVYLALAQAVLFVVLIFIVYMVIKNRNLFESRSVKRSKTLVEQNLVMEAISACAGEDDLESTVESIGNRACDVTGYSRWILWTTDETLSELRIHATNQDVDQADLESLKTSHDPKFYTWLRQNGESVRINKFILDYIESEILKKIIRSSEGGLLIPFIDGRTMLGFALLTQRIGPKEKRSKQFLSLFGAFAAIILKKSITDQKQDILKQKQHRTENLASLGQMAAGMAHEIRTPLTLIKSATQHLNDYYDYEPQDEELAGVITEEINKINQQIQELLILGRIAPEEFKEVDLRNILDKTTKLGSSKARENSVDIQVNLPAGPIKVIGSNDLLTQLFRNLVLNAIDAMEVGGVVSVSVESLDNRVKTTVKDNGPGIPGEVQERIFEPFFTTKSKGTGLGLSVSYNIAKAHEGELELVKSDYSGTTFTVDLPRLSIARGRNNGE